MKDLANKIHELLQKSSDVMTLMPASKFITGRWKSKTAFPYASITVPDATGSLRTNRGMYAARMVRVQIWDDSYDDCEAIAQAVLGALENQDFTMGRGRCIDLKGDEPYGFEEPDTTEEVYQFVVQLTATTTRSRKQ